MALRLAQIAVIDPFDDSIKFDYILNFQPTQAMDQVFVADVLFTHDALCVSIRSADISIANHLISAINVPFQTALKNYASSPHDVEAPSFSFMA